MTITFAPKGIVQIDDARIIFRNLQGKESTFNRAGDRNFSVLIDDEEVAGALMKEGWNVKIKDPRDPDDIPFMRLPVKVKFNGRGPNVYLQTGDSTPKKLNERTVGIIDDCDIMRVDLDIRPYDWEVNGKNGRTAYLQNMLVVQDIDRFAMRFAEEEAPEEDDGEDVPF